MEIRQWAVRVAPVVAAVGVLLSAVPALGAEPGAVEVVSNNLSFPAVFSGDPLVLRGTDGEHQLVGVLGDGWSFGCATPEAVDNFSYPNTSCVDDKGAALTAEACLAGPCLGLPLERIYWQKSASVWQAEASRQAGRVQAHWIDWGDNLESQTWGITSVVRVEVTPYASLPAPRLGFEMWHVFGQGPTELWGARASVGDPPAPVTYAGGYATVHSSGGRLVLTKLEPGVGDVRTPPAPEAFTWNGAGWDGAAESTLVTPGAELNIGGKVIYGFNWNLKRWVMTSTTVTKAGWWRLTFFDASANLDVLQACCVDVEGEICAPGPECTMSVAPPPPGAVAPTSLDEAVTEEADTGPLYTPALDSVRDLTFIDVYIQDRKRGR
jgi:hypothetical protein